MRPEDLDVDLIREIMSESRSTPIGLGRDNNSTKTEEQDMMDGNEYELARERYVRDLTRIPLGNTQFMTVGTDSIELWEIGSRKDGYQEFVYLMSLTLTQPEMIHLVDALEFRLGRMDSDAIREDVVQFAKNGSRYRPSGYIAGIPDRVLHEGCRYQPDPEIQEEDSEHLSQPLPGTPMPIPDQVLHDGCQYQPDPEVRDVEINDLPCPVGENIKGLGERPVIQAQGVMSSQPHKSTPQEAGEVKQINRSATLKPTQAMKRIQEMQKAQKPKAEAPHGGCQNSRFQPGDADTIKRQTDSWFLPEDFQPCGCSEGSPSGEAVSEVDRTRMEIYQAAAREYFRTRIGNNPHMSAREVADHVKQFTDQLLGGL